MFPLSSSRNEQIAQLHAQGFTYAEIAEQFGFTKQRAEQLVRRSAVPRQFVTPDELARAWNCNRSFVYRLARKAGLGRGLRRNFRFRQSEVAKLKELLEARRFRNCSECGTTISIRRTVCQSPACRSKNRTRARRQRLSSVPSEENTDLNGLPRRIWQLLQSEDPGFEYVCFAEALALTGLSRTQLSYLRERRIIRCRQDHAQLHRATGKPVNLYSKRHCLLIGRLRVESAQQCQGDLELLSTPSIA